MGPLAHLFQCPDFCDWPHGLAVNHSSTILLEHQAFCLGGIHNVAPLLEDAWSAIGPFSAFCGGLFVGTQCNGWEAHPQRQHLQQLFVHIHCQ